MATRSSKSTTTTAARSSSSFAATVSLKSRILSSLSKLSDRDTQQIGAEELEQLIQTLPAESVPVLLACLLGDPHRESVRLLGALCEAHPDPAAPHLPKIAAHLARRLRDPNSDSAIRDACRDAVGSVCSASASAVDALVKPMFDAMVGEQTKAVQAGAAACLARMVAECPTRAGPAFHKLCPRICKLLAGQSAFLAKGALLSLVAGLAQAGAISHQTMQPLLQSIRECLDSSDWATRKAAADTLIVLASHSSHLITDGAASTITAVEACRFDKVKPVRDSMVEALLLLKKITGKGEDGSLEDQKDAKKVESMENGDKFDMKRSNISSGVSEPLKDSSIGSFSPNSSDTTSKGKSSNMPEKAAVMLKKKAPSLNVKDLNPEFFQKLETRNSDDLPVEVVVPHRRPQSSHSQGEEDPELTDGDSRDASNHIEVACLESSDTRASIRTNYQNADKRRGAYDKILVSEDSARDKWKDQRGFKVDDLKARAFDANDKVEFSQKDPSATRLNISRSDGHAEGHIVNSKGNWLTIQRQLSQLDRQQASLMNMLQDFMGGSHNSMVTLENRVRGLERVVEEMARELALSGRRGGNMMIGYDEGSPSRSSSKYNGFGEYSGAKFGRAGDGRISFSERFLSSDGIVSGARGRDPAWRSDPEAWDSYAYTASRNGLVSSRRGLGTCSFDARLPRTEHDNDQVGSRRGWDIAQGPFRLGEGPSARSVWQASKDEATLEAIRVAGEDNGTSISAAREAVRELDAEALAGDNPGQDRGPLWESWTRAMDSLQIGDVDLAYAEVLSTGDDLLLVKLMEQSGPVVDQVSSEIAIEVLRAIAQFLLEQSLVDIAMTWIQQVVYLVEENGEDFLGIPLDGKREILLNLHKAAAASTTAAEEWEEEEEGAAPAAHRLMLQLASLWGLNAQLQHLIR